MVLPPSAPPVAAPAARAAAPRPRAAPAPARQPGGGAGGAPTVLAILLVLGGIGGLVFFKRGQALERAKKADEQAAARKAEEARKEQEDKRWVVLRVTFDEEVLPPDKRNVLEGSTQYLGMRVEVSNHGYEEVSVAPVYFTLSADGARYGRDTAAAVEYAPVTLRPGEKTLVPLAFEVPDARKAVVVEFRPAKPSKCNVIQGDSR